MAAHDTLTVNAPLPARRWSRPVAITLSDTNTDRNLQLNGKVPYRYIQNVGTSGVVQMTWEPDNSTVVALYIAQGEVIEGGYWVNARSTSTTGGVSLLGFIGVEGVEA